MESRSSQLNPGQIAKGEIIAGRYEVHEQIGTGGMGLVLRVVDRELNNEIVALKLLHSHLAKNESIFKRFQNEVLVARSLTHPNIVRIHDIGRSKEGFSYISMELVDGVSLRDRLERDDAKEGLKFDEALRFLFQICSGVAYAHEKEIIHRDLKPANVLLTSTEEVKLADFGMARILGMDTSLTQSGQMIGTPDYMSPEQIRGEILDARCDVYALGIIAYELVMGQKPFSADSSVAVAYKHLNEPLPDFDESHAVPKWYENLVKKATSKERDERFQNGMELAAEIIKNSPDLNSTGYFSVDATRFTSATPKDKAPLKDSDRDSLKKMDFSSANFSEEEERPFSIDLSASDHDFSYSKPSGNNQSRSSLPSVLIFFLILGLLIGVYLSPSGEKLLAGLSGQINDQIGESAQINQTDLEEQRPELEQELQEFIKEATLPAEVPEQLGKSESKISEDTTPIAPKEEVKKLEKKAKTEEKAPVEAKPVEEKVEKKEKKLKKEKEAAPQSKPEKKIVLRDTDPIARGKRRLNAMQASDQLPLREQARREPRDTPWRLPKTVRPFDTLKPLEPLERDQQEMAKLDESSVHNSKTFEQEADPSFLSESYSGTLRPKDSLTFGKESLSLILNLKFDGSLISGSAEVETYGRLRAKGKVYPRGVEINLNNSQTWIRLSGSRRKNSFRGHFVFPNEQTQGRWRAQRTGS